MLLERLLSRYDQAQISLTNQGWNVAFQDTCGATSPKFKFEFWRRDPLGALRPGSARSSALSIPNFIL
jgi:hypothetical protein